MLSLVIAIFVLSIYHASVIDSLTALIRKNNLQPFYIAGRTMAPNMIAAALGCTIALISATLVEPGSLQSNIVMGATMFVVLALLLCFAFAPLDTDWLGGAEAGDADDAGVLLVPPRRFQNTLDEIASAHNLSHRETEIFSLLARGYPASNIEEKLVISRHTVKSHTYSIYRKLDVSSKSELIKLIDNDAKDD